MYGSVEELLKTLFGPDANPNDMVRIKIRHDKFEYPISLPIMKLSLDTQIYSKIEKFLIVNFKISLRHGTVRHSTL